jgi:hypothetical protein
MRRLIGARGVVGVLGVALATVVAACSPQASATPFVTQAPLPTPTPSATPEPTVAPTPTPVPPYDGQPYSMRLPDGWSAFSPDDPASNDALDAFVAANPDMAATIEAFKALEGVTIAVDPQLGNVVVSYPFSTAGQSFDTLTTSFTSQFAALPGVTTAPVAEAVQLTAGPASHWDVSIEANDPGGGTYQVAESIYLVANGDTAVLVEFVGASGAAIPQEDSIIQSLQFTQ